MPDDVIMHHPGRFSRKNSVATVAKDHQLVSREGFDPVYDHLGVDQNMEISDKATAGKEDNEAGLYFQRY
ncbi:hypothetical protein GcM3_086025 [Golovinomyces cichoracearum]|uniref:Uncharacterized protein n=1 Tax=Golovinomyces cichoracearum TaxID=62708 RepID=A0A420IKK8_9PEZI|nr:hypothetical protein GcM3_086025 [Golovinomyces cichoracearum]